MQERFLAQVVACMKELLHCGLIGARHGPRLGAEIGAVAGCIAPIVGNAYGAFLGGILGCPLGFVMGVIGGAINRRWGWTIGGALPGFVLALLIRQFHIQRMGHINEGASSLIFWLGTVPFACGALAGGRLGRLLERSQESTYKLHRATTQENLAAIPIGIRLGLMVTFLLIVTDLSVSLWRFVASL